MRIDSDQNGQRIGRPVTWDADSAKLEIVRRLAAGETMKDICAAKNMPDRETVRKWTTEDPAFSASCVRARADHTLDEYDRMREIEADVLAGKIGSKAGRVTLASMQWRMCRVNRLLFGDHKTHEVTGAGGGPVQVAAVDPQVAALVRADPEASRLARELSARIGELQRQLPGSQVRQLPPPIDDDDQVDAPSRRYRSTDL